MSVAADQTDRRFRQRTRSFCNECSRETNHVVLRSDLEEDFDEKDRFYSYEIAEMQKCAGCGSVKLVFRRADDAMRTGEYDEDSRPKFVEDVQSFPAERRRRRPDWVWKWNSGLPPAYCPIMTEIYDGLDVGALTLVAMGIRTVIDIFAREKVGDIGGFEQKLQRLEEQGFIASLSRQHLGVVVDAGSAAAHRGGAFNRQQINHMLDAVEHLLQSQFIFRAPSRELRRATPRRRLRRRPRH